MTTGWPPPSRRDYVAGPTGSGKTHLLRVWARPFPRQLVLDTTGEWANLQGFAGEVAWAGDRVKLHAALQRFAALPRWRVVVPTSALEPEELVAMLVPMFQPNRASFTKAVGGLALVIDEAAEIAMNVTASKVRPLWLRGRHHGLSVLAASQRAADVGRMVTSQSERVAITRMMEPIDLAYWRQFLREEWFEALLALEERQAVCVNRVTQRAEVISTAGERIRVLS